MDQLTETTVKMELTITVEHGATVPPDVIVDYAAFLAARSYLQGSRESMLDDYILMNERHGETAMAAAARENADAILLSQYTRSSAELNPVAHGFPVGEDE